MAKPPKRRIPNSRIESSRITPKGTKPQTTDRDGLNVVSSRNRPPSPPWVTVLLFCFLGLGGVIIVLNYVGIVPGGEASNIYLLVGLGFIFAGLVTATQLR